MAHLLIQIPYKEEVLGLRKGPILLSILVERIQIVHKYCYIHNYNTYDNNENKATYEI